MEEMQSCHAPLKTHANTLCRLHDTTHPMTLHHNVWNAHVETDGSLISMWCHFLP